jgi:hypothetical protein
MAAAIPTTLKSAAGFYIATGKWLDTEFGVGELHKVGHTGDLGARLNDGSYITCFPPGHWRYVATFELPTKEEAFLLETAVLHCCRHRRLDPRELVRMRAEEIIAVAVAAADALGLKPVRRNAPKYVTALRGASLTAANTPSVPTAWAASKSLVDRLTIPKTDPLDDLAAGVAAMTIVNEDFGQARCSAI